MSDLNEWLKERRTIHEAATEGPWKQDEEDGVRGVDLYTNAEDEEFEDRWERRDADIRTWDADDATAIVDAHNTLPTLLTAVEKVLELHHWERDEYGCWTCRFCSHIQQAKILYPCATVRTVEGAIK